MTEREKFMQTISEIPGLSAEEKTTYEEGTKILLELDWPIDCIQFAMCERAIKGLVPKYESSITWMEYLAQWAKEDNAAALKRSLALPSNKLPETP